jgi:hypothetical protein
MLSQCIESGMQISVYSGMKENGTIPIVAMNLLQLVAIFVRTLMTIQQSRYILSWKLQMIAFSHPLKWRY